MDRSLDLTKLSDAELKNLSDRIVELLRDRQRAKIASELAKFGVGDRVSFDSSDGEHIEGEVVRVSRKTVTVCSGDRHHWRVSPSFLTKVSGPPAPWEPIHAAKKGREEEPEEPSQAQFDRTRKVVDGWWVKFEKSLLYKGLSEEHQRDGLHIVTAFSDFMYNYAGYTPTKWDPGAVHEICTEIMPRKIAADEGFFAAIAPVLTQFFGFLAQRGFQKNAVALVRSVHGLGEQILSAAQKPTNWGPGKILMNAAEQAGVDTSDPAALQTFIQAYNAGLLSDRLGSRLLPRQEPVRNDTKVGRNEQCPCGSGKKFKKCCAGKLSLVDTRR